MYLISCGKLLNSHDCGSHVTLGNVWNCYYDTGSFFYPCEVKGSVQVGCENSLNVLQSACHAPEIKENTVQTCSMSEAHYRQGAVSSAAESSSKSLYILKPCLQPSPEAVFAFSMHWCVSNTPLSSLLPHNWKVIIKKGETEGHIQLLHKYTYMDLSSNMS